MIMNPQNPPIPVRYVFRGGAFPCPGRKPIRPTPEKQQKRCYCCNPTAPPSSSKCRHGHAPRATTAAGGSPTVAASRLVQRWDSAAPCLLLSINARSILGLSRSDCRQEVTHLTPGLWVDSPLAQIRPTGLAPGRSGRDPLVPRRSKTFARCLSIRIAAARPKCLPQSRWSSALADRSDMSYRMSYRKPASR